MTEDKSADFNSFLKQLKTATSKIESDYFKLPTAGSESKIYRERVYCYELYYQLRCTLGNGFHYKLYGEVDKNAHHLIEGEKKPDFIVHVPGTMDENLAVIEVKSIDADLVDIKNDIEKLKNFLDYYYRTIMLIYSDDSSKVECARSKIDKLAIECTKCADRILLLWHKKPGNRAEVISHA